MKKILENQLLEIAYCMEILAGQTRSLRLMYIGDT